MLLYINLIILIIMMFMPFNISKLIAFYGTLILLFCVYFYIIIYFSEYNFINIEQLNFSWIDRFNFNLYFCYDGLSLIFISLTLFIMLTVFLYFFSIKEKYKNNKHILFILILLQFTLILTFLTQSLFWFYIFFEMILIPIYLIIGILGTKSRKIKASYYLFYYTLFGSIFFLAALIYIYFKIYNLINNFSIFYLDTETIKNYLVYFNIKEQLILVLFILIPFFVKIPTYPVHIWLPEAHVEAPTIGSVILAALLLKIGGFGLCKFIIKIFILPLYCMSDYIILLLLISVIYSSICTLIQEDLKKTIAYSSIVHMNMALIGFFMFNLYGFKSFILLMLAHGLVSAGLFFVIGFIYNRLNTRIRLYISGLVFYYPIMCFFFFLLCFSNVGFPGTVNFMGEFLLFLSMLNFKNINIFLDYYSLFYINFYYFIPIIFLFVASIFTLLFSVGLYNNIFYGSDYKLIKLLLTNVLNTSNRIYNKFKINKNKNNILYNLFLYKNKSMKYIKLFILKDVSKIEFLILTLYIFFIIYFGINSTIIVNFF